MPEGSLKDKTAKGLLWGGINSLLQQLLTLLIGIILLTHLSPADFGTVGILAIFTGIANMIRDSGFTAALTNRPEFKHDDYNAVFWFNIAIGCVVYIILFFTAPLIAAFFDMPELTLISRILFLSIVLGAFGIAHTAVLFRHLMIKERAKIDFFSLSLACVITLVFLYLDFGYWALVANQLSISFFGTLFRWIFSPWKPNFSFSITPLKEMFGFSSKLLIAEIVNSVQQNILSFMIGKHSTRADVGYFSEGKKWADTGTTFIYLMINGVAQPVFSKDISDKERTVKILHKLIHFSVFMSFPVMCGIAFISKDFISILNIEFLPCVPIMYIFCLLRTVYPILTLYTQLGTALGKSSFIFKSTLLLTIAQIVSAFIALPYGINWVALSNAVISLIYLLVWHFYISSLVPIKLSAVIKDIFPYAAVTGLVFLITWAATYRLENHYIAIIAKVSLCASLYLIIMKLTNSAIFNEIIEYLKKALNPILENIKK